ncbi:MAG: hypothetical protein EOP48_32430, partial [Sphingobacteriales bacterium]
MTRQNRTILSIAIKVTLVVLAFWFIIKKVSDNQDLGKFVTYARGLPNAEITLLLTMLIGLMFVNWGIEVVKWRRVVERVERISIWKSVQSVFCGLTLAVFTPNRIGEYGGRVFFLSPKRRIVGIVAMAIGGLGQMITTNVFGALAICGFVYKFIDLDYRLFYAIALLAVFFCIFLLVFYFNISWIKGFLTSFRFTKKYQKFYAILGRYTKRELLTLLLMGLARYVVFSTQYLILVHWLVPGLYLGDVIMMVSILFFIQSSLPSLNLFDV